MYLAHRHLYFNTCIFTYLVFHPSALLLIPYYPPLAADEPWD